MMKAPVMITALLAVLASTSLRADAVSDVQNYYGSQGAGPFQSDRGEQLWNSRAATNHQCADCHGQDLAQLGQHQRTKKTIAPMAPSVTPERYTDLDKVEKWFMRNCKWTWGRECTAQEKGDLIEYLKQL